MFLSDAEFAKRYGSQKTTLSEEEFNKKYSTEKPSFIEGVKTDLSKRGANIKAGWERQLAGGQSGAETGFQIVGNVIGGIGDIVGKGLIKLGSFVIPDFIEKKIGDAGKAVLKTPAGQKFIEVASDGLESYKAWKAENPREASNIESALNVGDFILDLATFGGKTAVTSTAKEIAGEGLEKGIKETVPQVVEKGIKEVVPEVVQEGGEQVAKKQGKDIGATLVSQVSGLDKDTIKTIVKDPIAFEEVSKNLDRETLANEVATAVNKRIDDLSELGKEYNVIRNSKQVVTMPENSLENILSGKYGLTFGKDGKIITSAESAPLSQGDINTLQGFMAQYGSEKVLSPNAFLNARKALDNMAKWDSSKTDLSSKIARDIRAELDKYGKQQIKGLAVVDARYAPEVQTLNDIKKDILNPDGTLKDTAISKIANLTGKGKEQVLKRVKEFIPDIEEKVNILKALEDIDRAKGIKVGTYAKAGLTGISGVLGGLSGGVGGAGVGAIAGLILSSPQVVVPLLKNYGKIKNIAIPRLNIAISQLKKNALSPKNKELMVEMLEYMGDAMISSGRKEGIRETTAQ